MNLALKGLTIVRYKREGRFFFVCFVNKTGKKKILLSVYCKTFFKQSDVFNLKACLNTNNNNMNKNKKISPPLDLLKKSATKISENFDPHSKAFATPQSHRKLSY